MTTPANLHSSATAEHYTPPEIVEAAREVMGGIDLDPASCAEANTIVKAAAYYDSDGLSRPWYGRVFLNPPGGKLDRNLNPIGAKDGPGYAASAVWWWKLLDELDAGRVTQAVFVCFSLNVFQNSQRDGGPPPYLFPFVVPSSRLKFWGAKTPIGTGAPSHPNAIVYVPPDENIALARFDRVFSKFGAVRT